jgi:hypothetical protein
MLAEEIAFNNGKSIMRMAMPGALRVGVVQPGCHSISGIYARSLPAEGEERKQHPHFMKRLIFLGLAAFSAVLLSACEDGDHDHHHHHDDAATTTTTTEETTVHQVAPASSSTTTVRSY